MIEVRELHHRYRSSGPEAVRGVSFEVAAGECFGFLGPNGAGKSTTIKLLTGQLPLGEGRVRVNGFDLRHPTPAYFETIGVSFELPNVYGKLTVLENLELFRRLYRGPTEDPMAVLESVGLQEAAGKRAEACSRGMMQRLVFARSLLNRPKVLFLDEPTGGLDPDIALELRTLIRGVKAAGTTVFLTTHNMFEADSLCDRVAFIHEGQIKALDTPQRLKLAFGRRAITVELDRGDRTEALELSMDEPRDGERLGKLLATERVLTVHSREATLEDAFVRLVTGGAPLPPSRESQPAASHS